MAKKVKVLAVKPDVLSSFLEPTGRKSSDLFIPTHEGREQ